MACLFLGVWLLLYFPESRDSELIIWVPLFALLLPSFVGRAALEGCAALRGEPMLALDESGLHDQRLGLGPLAWSDVSIMEEDEQGTWVRVRGLERYRAATGFLAWLVKPGHLGYGILRSENSILVETAGTGLGPGELRDLLVSHREAGHRVLASERAAEGKPCKQADAGGAESELAPAA
jgi:hypothetical protein